MDRMTRTHYRIDPELAAAAELFDPLDPDDHAASRAAMASMPLPGYEPHQSVTVSEHVLDGSSGSPGSAGPSGSDVRVRLYRPDRPAPHPAILYPHWGGFVAGGLDLVDAAARRMADQVGAVVVSVDYRLAPEHPYPAALDDCWTALTWTVEHSATLGIDPDRVAVVGESAGGGLAAALALRARDWGGPTLAFQALSFPQLDDRLDTVSARAFTDTPMWDRRSASASWRDYLAGQPADRYAAPARADDLTGLPPTFVAACEFDPLRDEDLTYATRLVAAGVPTELHLYPGTFHASTAVGTAAVSRRMIDDLITALRTALTETDPAR